MLFFSPHLLKRGTLLLHSVYHLAVFLGQETKHRTVVDNRHINCVTVSKHDLSTCFLFYFWFQNKAVSLSLFEL